MDINKVVAKYIELRDQKKSLETQLKQDLAPIKQDMETIEAALQKYMQDHGLTSIKTQSGTPYLAEAVSAQVTDWDSILAYAIEHEQYDLFERRVAKKTVQDLNEQGESIPGVDLVTTIKTNVRRN